MSTDEQTPFDRYRTRIDRPLVRLFADYGTSRTRWLVIGLVANLLAQTASLLPPVVLGTAIDALFREETSEYSLLFLPRAWIPPGEVAQFWLSVALIAGSFVATALFTWIYGVSANFFAHGVMHSVRSDSFEKMLRLDAAFFDDKQTGEVMSILSNDSQNLELFLDNALMNGVRLIVMVLGIAAILFALNWQLALVTLVAIPLIGGFTVWFMRVIEPRYEARQSAMADFNTRIENGITGVILAKVTGSEDYEVDRVRDASHGVFETTMDVLKLSYFYRPGMELLAGFSFAATFLVGGYWILFDAPGPLTGDLSVGVFVTFVFMTQRFVAPLAEVSNIVDEVQNAKVSAARVFGLADIPVRITDREDAKRLGDPEGRVTYEDVCFSYPELLTDDHGPAVPDDETETDGGFAALDGDEGDDDSVIEHVSFEAEPGETVAFVGSTGAGKSTLCRLLLRLYDVDEGRVAVDGTDIRDLELASLRQHVGYVSQDAFLFDGTIGENIRYGRFDESDEAVREAAEAAEAHEFIQRLPDGYDTRVGERGVKLSGGQRQRIAIARVVLQDPEILILDEATSDVDTDTEQRIQASLDALTADRTTFVVAHRLSTVIGADTILVLEDGEVVERGDHDTLRQQGGRYAELWGAQTGSE
ncbi:MULTISPECIES: ABC transporter ATP-binding protein [Halomicrobium]|uniref:ABC transporter related n=2 Tax=Halomicrobium mukohataei TaxID=57705 RepID=C7NXU8_HALMD|nr:MULTISPECIES: ABC transporter ATP-binding protein [Halomicrobium]ACV46536.1 ABC transporter related [Halomicrobium mukohataei DSM 12286]QCD65079.1 ABC transporter ATP-binding protein [Halomicrobium mukohataei]QFR19885.1 ATP-binding cassette domain-containing protein [Halomicrobium sp. ZPS1]